MDKTCPDHGPIEGLGVCWVDDCGFDARKAPAKERGPAGRKQAPADATLTLPWSSLVSVNKRFGGAVGKTTTEYKSKLHDMTLLLSAQYHGAKHTGEVAVNLFFYPPHRRADLHNYQKALYDALKHAEVYEDDKKVVDWSGRLVEIDKDEPRVEVTVRSVREAVA